MVLSNTNSFISLVLLVGTLSLGTATKGLAQTQQRLPRKSSTDTFRYGAGLLTLPQQLRLNSSDGRTIEVSSVQTGPLLSMDYERRQGRWIYLGALGLSYLSMKNTSQDSSVQYSAGLDYLSYSANVGAHYISSRNVKLGTSFWILYNSFNLPTPSSPGTTYAFDYGSPVKNFVSLDFNWQLHRRLLLSQSLLIPINKDMRTGWVISLKSRF